MFDSIALFPAVLRGDTSTKAPSRGLRALLRAALEGLVKAHSNRFQDPRSPEFRFPPF